MEDTAALKAKLEGLLKEAAAVAVALGQADGTISGTPHYSAIEGQAHELGKQLSREVQSRQMGELAARRPIRSTCPDCGMGCELVPSKRRVKSVDGVVPLLEMKGHCPVCRRDFFPR